MKRTEFLQKIFGAGALLFLPVNPYKEKKKSCLLKFGVRGFQFYSGPALIDSIKPGELLTLIREPENKFDRHAIALHYQGEKIGFVPREKNEVLSGLLDSDTALLSAEIIKVEDNSNSWEEVQVGIYLVGQNAMVA